MAKTPLVSTIVSLVLALTLAPVFAAPPDQVPEKKRTKLGLYLTAPEAYALTQKEKVLFIDVRTRAEVGFLGMPTVADANIPYMETDEWYSWDDKKGTFKLDVNSNFMPEIEKRLLEKAMSTNDKIIVMCRSGDRSAKAADLLAKAGYTNVYTVIDGYEGDVAKEGPNKGKRAVNGWRNSDLPWSYQLVKSKMYLP